MRLLAISLVFLLIVASGMVSISNASQSDGFSSWSKPAYDLENTNYDPQNIINLTNAQNLEIRWIYQVPVNPFNIPGAPPALGIETTPLVVSGIVYFATPYNRLVALNAVNGHEVWHFQVNLTEFAKDPWWSQAYTISSLTYNNGTLYMMASDTSVYAINAISGQVEFVIPGTGSNIPGNTGTYYGEKAPLVYKNMLIVRASTTDYGGRGFLAAYDLTTRGLLWRWFSVPPAGGATNWDANASLGNVKPYPGDWGNNTLMGGAAAWGLMTVDQHTGLLYFSTGHPSGGYDASSRPGPNLYSDSIIALNATNGRLVWYYQFTSHDLAEHEGGWSLTLGSVSIGGQKREVLIQASKNNYIYVLDSATGKPVYDPIRVGPASLNSPNDNEVSGAALGLSQSIMVGSRICPGPDGGVEMSPALHGSNLFVVTQNACGLMYRGPITYKGQTIQGYVYVGDPTAPQNATVYSIDLSSRTVNWKFELTDRYQGSSAVVSGGVVYVVDRQGSLYMLNEQTGQAVRSVELNGLGASGVTLGEDSSGTTMLFVPAGGGDIPTSTAGVVVGFAIVGGVLQQQTGSQSLEGALVALGITVALLGGYILLRRGRGRSPPN